jgi:ferredoxin
MVNFEDGTADRLRELLDRVEGKAATQRLMAAIAHTQGHGVDELADWYGFDPGELEAWFRELDRDPEAAVADVERFTLPGRGTTPATDQTSAVVEYLDYEVLGERGWSLDDEALFERANAADLPLAEHGRIFVEEGESILEAAEKGDREWPFACNAGACSNCAAIVVEGGVAMPGNQILPEAAVERGARLTCVGAPTTDEVKLVYNAKGLDYLEELRLPAERFTGQE